MLATERASPNTIPAIRLHPSQSPSKTPKSVAVALWTTAPGKAILRTSRRSRTEKCSPTPNISRITPISASSAAIAESATTPGVKGPTSTPASR